MPQAENVTMKVVKNKLTIEVDLSKRLRKSATGKTFLIASSGGNQPIGDSGAVLGLNVFTKEGID